MEVRPFLFMRIGYSQVADREVHEEVNTKGRDLSGIFGFHFQNVVFDGKNADMARNMEASVDVRKANRMMAAIFGNRPPSVRILFNTTPFSTWNTEKKYVSISFQRYPNKVFSSFCHELNHYMYDIIFGTEKYEETEQKETMTVLNELFNVKDYGWKMFDVKRKEVLDAFKKGENIYSLRKMIS